MSKLHKLGHLKIADGHKLESNKIERRIVRNTIEWTQPGKSDDVIFVGLTEQAHQIILFEGNRVGFGRRTILTQEGSLKHEHGYFYAWNLDLREHLDII